MEPETDMNLNKLNKRALIESMIVVIVIMVGVVGFKVVQGALLTRNYVPDVINNYASVEHLQQQVAFGTIVRTDGLTLALEISGLLLLAAAYYMLRTRLVGLRKRKK
ncbi:hypothetical protein YSY43_17020 [Paenibacillus sp. YSY-4.3]